MKMTTQKYIDLFRSELNAGLEGIRKASEIYVQAIDADPASKEVFMEKFDGTVPPSAWSGFEAVGRKNMHFKLLLGGGKHGNLIKRLPYSDQKHIMDGGKVEMLTSGGDSLMVDMQEVTIEQARQLVGGDHIRTLSEQRAYIESQNTAIAQYTIEETAAPPPYKISGGKMYVRADTVLTKRELKRMVEVM